MKNYPHGGGGGYFIVKVLEDLIKAPPKARPLTIMLLDLKSSQLFITSIFFYFRAPFCFFIFLNFKLELLYQVIFYPAFWVTNLVVF